MGLSFWLLLIVLALVPFVVVRAIVVASHRRERALAAERWRASWAPIAAARRLRLEPEFSKDLNGGFRFRQTWWALHGNAGSVAYRVGLGAVTCGYDGLLMLEATVNAPQGVLIYLGLPGTNPLHQLTPLHLPAAAAHGLELFSNDARTARAVVTDDLCAAVADIPGASLVVRGKRAQVVLCEPPEGLDLPLLDAAVRAVAVLASNTENTALHQ